MAKYVGKRKISEMNYVSLISDVLSEYGYQFQEDPPDMWNDEEKKLFDMLSNMEDRLKEALIAIINT